MANISRNELRSAVKELLKGADLDSLSTKKIRLALQGKFDTDFTDRKKEVDEIVMSLLDESQEQEEEKTNNTKRNGNTEEHDDDSNSECELSEEDEPPKKKSKSNTQQAKKVKNKSAEIVPDDDEDLARQLQEDDGRRRSGRTPQKAPKEKKKTQKSDGERKAKGYGKPCLLSPALAEVMGTDRLPRCDVVKKMYAIAKEKNLQDPKNRQFMICDDALFKIFGKKRVKMFGMMKHLSAHITDHHKIPDLS